jgi:hypothetical protein
MVMNGELRRAWKVGVACSKVAGTDSAGIEEWYEDHSQDFRFQISVSVWRQEDETPQWR